MHRSVLDLDGSVATNTDSAVYFNANASTVLYHNATSLDLDERAAENPQSALVSYSEETFPKRKDTLPTQ